MEVGGARKQGKGIEGETGGTCCILSLMAFMPFNKQPLFISIHSQIRGVSTSCCHRKVGLAAPIPGKSWGKKQRERRGVIKVKTRSHMGGRILNDSPCSKTSPTEGLNFSPSLSIHLSLSLAEMQLIRIERAKCAEIEQAGCALAHAGGRTVSHSPEQIQIWGFRSSTSWPNFILSFPPCVSEFFSEGSILQQPWQKKKTLPSSCTAALTPHKLFAPTTLGRQSVKNK